MKKTFIRGDAGIKVLLISTAVGFPGPGLCAVLTNRGSVRDSRDR
jgi:hypothetical protein